MEELIEVVRIISQEPVRNCMEEQIDPSSGVKRNT